MVGLSPAELSTLHPVVQELLVAHREHAQVQHRLWKRREVSMAGSSA